MGFLTLRQIIATILFLTLFTSCFQDDDNQRQRAPAATSNSSAPVRWNPATIGGGLNIKISTSFTNMFVAGDNDSSGRHPIEQMMHAWNQSTNTYDFFLVPASTTSNKDYSSLATYRTDGEMGIYRSDNWYSGVSSSALAITQYFGTRKNTGTNSEFVELFHADIMVNYRDHSFTLDATNTTTFDLHTVILHELGHFIGLPHESNNSSNAVMLPFLSRSETKRSLTATDISNVRSLYSVSSLSANNVQGLAAVKKNGVSNNTEGEEVRGVIELRADGHCVHYENDKEVYRHRIKPDSLKSGPKKHKTKKKSLYKAFRQRFHQH